MSTNTELIARSERVASELDDHNANMDRRARTCIRELVAALKSMEQAITDPENQPSQFGTVLLATHQALEAEVERLKTENSANMATCNGVIQGLTAERDALQAKLTEVAQTNHQWHHYHDDFDGYEESDLWVLNMSALSHGHIQHQPAQQAQPEPIGTPEQAARFLAKSLKPEEIGGAKRNERLRELMRWFDRFIDGNANPKWFRDHAYELAYAIATQQAQPEPHLFEFWWAEYMPDATQEQAFKAWSAVPSSKGVGVTQPAEQVNAMLVEALEEARNGLAWYQAMYPGATDGSDDEAMERIDAALTAAKDGASDV